MMRIMARRTTGEAVVGVALEVASQAAVATDPSEGPPDNPLRVY
jgi:hypothetical protein